MTEVSVGPNQRGAAAQQPGTAIHTTPYRYKVSTSTDSSIPSVDKEEYSKDKLRLSDSILLELRSSDGRSYRALFQDETRFTAPKLIFWRINPSTKAPHPVRSDPKQYDYTDLSVFRLLSTATGGQTPLLIPSDFRPDPAPCGKIGVYDKNTKNQVCVRTFGRSLPVAAIAGPFIEIFKEGSKDGVARLHGIENIALVEYSRLVSHHQLQKELFGFALGEELGGMTPVPLRTLEMCSIAHLPDTLEKYGIGQKKNLEPF